MKRKLVTTIFVISYFTILFLSACAVTEAPNDAVPDVEYPGATHQAYLSDARTTATPAVTTAPPTVTITPLPDNYNEPNPDDFGDAYIAAVAFLEKSTRAVYFYEENEIEGLTIVPLAEESGRELDSLAQLLSSQREQSEMPDYADPFLTPISTSSLLLHLKWFSERIAYWGSVYESEQISYTWFEAKYTPLSINETDTIAILDIYETLEYQYSHLYEYLGEPRPTSEGKRYTVTLFFINESWLVATVESDEQYYQWGYGPLA